MENYSAWIMGEIPRLRLYRPTISPECPVILHGTPREHHFATLKLFGIDESMIIPIPEETDIEVEELIYGTPAYRRHIPSPSGIAFLRESSCSFSLNEAWKDSRVYLTRLGQKLRRISNEDQIHDVLEGLGFRIVRPETLSVLDQVSLFSLAETIVTPFGATLANMAFCQERTRVCVIRTKFTNEFARLATMSGTKLSVFDKISRTKAPFFARNRELHQTFHVDTKSLKEFVTCLADGHR
jgi:capsular polysaccharide biosynthesis protein